MSSQEIMEEGTVTGPHIRSRYCFSPTPHTTAGGRGLLSDAVLDDNHRGWWWCDEESRGLDHLGVKIHKQENYFKAIAHRGPIALSD